MRHQLEHANLEGKPRRVVLEMPSFQRWLRSQPRETQRKHLKAMLRAGNCTISQFGREFRRLWDA